MDLNLVIVISLVVLAIFIRAIEVAITKKAHLDDTFWRMREYAEWALTAGRTTVGLSSNEEVAAYAARALKERFPKLDDLQLEVLLGSVMNYPVLVKPTDWDEDTPDS